MDTREWGAFVTDVVALVRKASGARDPYVQVMRGTGRWRDDPNLEDSAYISYVGGADERERWRDDALEVLEEGVANLAANYGQDAIALVTSSRLVEARRV